MCDAHPVAYGQGIASTLILIHVGLGLSWEQSVQLSTLSWAPASRPVTHTLSMPTPIDVIEGSYRPDGEVYELHSPRPSKDKRRTSAVSLTSMPSFSTP